MKLSRLLVTVIVVLLASLLAETTTPAATTPAMSTYYKGKVVTFICPHGAGGGGDMFTRLLARNIGKYIPGNPSIVVKNVVGGGSIQGANEGYNAKPDGLTLFAPSNTSVALGILRPSGVVFDLSKMYPIYSTPIGAMQVIRSGILKEAKELAKPEIAAKVVYGMDSAAGGGTNFGIIQELCGFKVAKEVYGYAGAAEAFAAALRGELDSCGGSTLSYFSSSAQYVATGEFMPLLQSGIFDLSGKVVREPAAPDCPTVPELYQQIHGKPPSGAAWEAYKVFGIGANTYGKALLLPPGTPRNITDMWMKAASDMVKDPKFIAEHQKMLPKAPHFVGEGLGKAYPAAVSSPPEITKWLKDFFKEKYGLVFN